MFVTKQRTGDSHTINDTVLTTKNYFIVSQQNIVSPNCYKKYRLFNNMYAIHKAINVVRNTFNSYHWEGV